MDRGFADRYVFHSPDRTITATDNVGGCTFVSLVIDGRQQPALSGSIDGVVLQELGLPLDYGN